MAVARDERAFPALTFGCPAEGQRGSAQDFAETPPNASAPRFAGFAVEISFYPLTWVRNLDASSTAHLSGIRWLAACFFVGKPASQSSAMPKTLALVGDTRIGTRNRGL